MTEIRAWAQSIGQKIRECRLARNLTQDELADGYFSKSYISQLERGSVNPSLKSLKILADKLGVPCAWLLDSGNSAGAQLVREASACFFLGDIRRSEQLALRVQALVDTLAHADLLDYHLLRIRLAAHHQRWAEVLEACSQLSDLAGPTLSSFPRHAVPHRYYWGKAWLEGGNRRLAVRQWERGLETLHAFDAPPSFEGLQLLRDLSLLYRQLGDPQAAEAIESRIAGIAMRVKRLDDLVAWTIDRRPDRNGTLEAHAVTAPTVGPDFTRAYDLADAEAWARAMRTLSVAAALRAAVADRRPTATPTGS